MAGSVKEVGSQEWEKDVLGSKGLMMVDFWAPWCGPCRSVAPIVEELSVEYAGKVQFVKLNTDDNQDIAVRYQVMGIPTLMFFKDGQIVDKVVGAQSKKNFKDKIDTLLAS
ncbi:thioredoxin [Leptospirillum ferrooxidans]|jgi:thioredoxin 1|uniref:Thioredoxin n=1 Tax=Leptospirillum ferrooxidans (strain C2-3) TaxID=1162668 RepID=I0IPK1_LEPFC|nr:thioredoxin [Leptospirillum ferrooxidans]BAM07200.1 thioredoxin 1 [Leptospirillum ferrooxidans C2-3]